MSKEKFVRLFSLLSSYSSLLYSLHTSVSICTADCKRFWLSWYWYIIIVTPALVTASHLNINVKAFMTHGHFVVVASFKWRTKPRCFECSASSFVIRLATVLFWLGRRYGIWCVCRLSKLRRTAQNSWLLPWPSSFHHLSSGWGWI